MMEDEDWPSLLTTRKEMSPFRSSSTAGFSGKGTAGLDSGSSLGCPSSPVSAEGGMVAGGDVEALNRLASWSWSAEPLRSESALRLGAVGEQRSAIVYYRASDAQ